MKGNFKVNIEFWKCIGVFNFIILIIDNGYSLLFVNLFEFVKLWNNKLVWFYIDFVD